MVMGDVVRFRARSNGGSVDELQALLLTRGGLAVAVGDLDVPADVWRSNARRVGRELGRPVRTGQSEDGRLVWAELKDWPASPDERLRHDAALRPPLWQPLLSSRPSRERAESEHRAVARGAQHRGRCLWPGESAKWLSARRPDLPSVRPPALHDGVRVLGL